jgi:hypothetical protein
LVQESNTFSLAASPPRPRAERSSLLPVLAPFDGERMRKFDSLSEQRVGDHSVEHSFSQREC